METNKIKKGDRVIVKDEIKRKRKGVEPLMKTAASDKGTVVDIFKGEEWIQDGWMRINFDSGRKIISRYWYNPDWLKKI